MQSPVTLRQIARRLKINHSTVSRALKDDSRISKPVRQRVRREAERMGYRPDPMLTALSHYRRRQSPHRVTAALGWVNTWPTPGNLRTFKEFDLYWKGAKREAEKSGYHLDEFNCPHEMTPGRLNQVLRTRGIQGMLLPPGWSAHPINWDGFRWDDFAVVRFGHSLPLPQAHVVTSDQLANGSLGFQRIRQNGYRCIGMVTRRHLVASVVRFAAGYLHAQLQVSARHRLSPLLLREPDREADRRALASWLGHAKPDAILTDLADLRQMLVDCGYRVPGDLGLAALSVLDGKADAGIYQNSEEIGVAAVQLLISLIHHNERGIPVVLRELLIPGRWVDGKSLPLKKGA